MFVKKSISLIFLFVLFTAANAQRVIDGEKIAIINGRTTSLPKPDYPQEAKDFCVSGKVEVLIEVMASGGKPLTAKAISGDDLSRESAEKAAMQAIFTPYLDLITDFKIKGIIVYNFPPEKKCFDAGVVNKKAKSIPKPLFPKNCRCAGFVKVEVIIDILSGEVTNARAISGHPLLRLAAVEAAKKTVFYPSMINSKPFFAKGLLVYDFAANGKVKF